MPLLAFFPWLFFFLMLLLPLIRLRRRSKRSKVSYELPPGPSQLHFIGNLHQLDINLPHRSFLSLSKIHGPLMYLKLGRIPTIVISSAKMAREVMKSQDNNFCNRPSLVAWKTLSYDFKDVAFSPYSPAWRDQRKIFVLNLVNTKRVQSFESIRESEVSSMIGSIASSSLLSAPVDLSEMLPTLSTNIVCQTAFGKSYQKVGERGEARLPSVIDEARVLLGTFFATDFFPQMWWIDVLRGLSGRLRRTFDNLDSLYERLIEERLDPERPKAAQEDLLDVILNIQREQHLTRDQLKSFIMDMMLAGTDTNAALMVWVMAELMRNPIVMKKVQEEVRSVVGRKGKVEERDLHQLQYLHLVIKETLRLHPPGPLLISRETMEHCKIDGYDIFPKTRVFINAMAIAQDPESWENPEDFIPERFENNPVDYKGQDFEFIPFGAGRRGCPGMYFATMIMQLALANLTYSFDWKLPDGMRAEDLDMKESFGLVVHRKEPLRLLPVKRVF